MQLEIDSRPEAFADVEKVVPKLMAAIDDAHFKVRVYPSHNQLSAMPPRHEDSCDVIV